MKESISDNNAWKKVLKEDEIIPIIKQFFDAPQSAHQGINKTYYAILTLYYWPSMREDIKRNISKCIFAS